MENQETESRSNSIQLEAVFWIFICKSRISRTNKRHEELKNLDSRILQICIYYQPKDSRYLQTVQSLSEDYVIVIQDLCGWTYVLTASIELFLWLRWSEQFLGVIVKCRTKLRTRVKTYSGISYYSDVTWRYNKYT